MSKIRKGTENLSDISHEQILANNEAEKLAKIMLYHEYMETGFEPDVALEMAGVKKEDLD